MVAYASPLPIAFPPPIMARVACINGAVASIRGIDFPAISMTRPAAINPPDPPDTTVSLLVDAPLSYAILINARFK